ncbi:MAG: hypothetical protein KAU48_07275, partial [Candidatus Thorarchaeota archaeon]|nr:hypothetical protein [Candidatus Thorarchaeota archaeon]
ALTNGAQAVRIIFDNSLIFSYGTIPKLVTNLLFLAIFSFLVLIAVIMKKKERITNRVIFTISSISISIIFYIIMQFIVIPLLSTEYLIVLGLALGIFTSLILPISGILESRISSKVVKIEFAFLVAGFAVFGNSCVPLVYSLFFPSLVWTLAFPLQTIGLILLCLASALPFLKRIGVKTTHAYILTLVLTMLAVLPTGLTTISSIYFVMFSLPNRELFMVVHLGASLMAVVMVLLKYQYDQQHPQKRRPVISLFIVWATVEAYQVAQAILLPIEYIGQSVIPYLIGSLFLLAQIPNIINRTTNSQEKQSANPKRMALLALPILVLILVLDIIRVFISGSAIFWILQLLTRSTLLASALLGMFVFIYHISFQITENQGRITVDVLTTGFLALWIIPSMIKANYIAWTIGWWASEILLLITVLLGPAVLGLMYLNELRRSTESQKRATLFADLLVHDITNYHQALALSIGILEMDEAGVKAKEQAIRDAYRELQRADQLVRNVRRLGMAEELVPELLPSINLIPILNESFALASRKNKKQEIKYRIDAPPGEYFVRANALLNDVFINVFDNSIKYTDGDPEIIVTIKEFTRNRETWISISISDNGRGIDPKRRTRMFDRYMEDAAGTGLGLNVVQTLIHAYGGSIIVEERVPGDYKQGTVFTIILKKG